MDLLKILKDSLAQVEPIIDECDLSADGRRTLGPFMGCTKCHEVNWSQFTVIYPNAAGLECGECGTLFVSWRA